MELENMPSEATESLSDQRSLQKGTRVAPLSKEERRERFDALSDLGCAICGCPPQIHHLIGVKYRGLSQKADDRLTIPLCMNHHTGQQGIHKIGKKQWEFQYGTQEHLLEVTNYKIQMLEQIKKYGYVDKNFYDFDEVVD
jgi:hypothetical protein